LASFDIFWDSLTGAVGISTLQGRQGAIAEPRLLQTFSLYDTSFPSNTMEVLLNNLARRNWRESHLRISKELMGHKQILFV
jgi:hypothetical protein